MVGFIQSWGAWCIVEITGISSVTVGKNLVWYYDRLWGPVIDRLP